MMEGENGKRRSSIPLFAASAILLAIIAVTMIYLSSRALDMPVEEIQITNLLHERTRACANPSLAGRCKEIEKELEALAARMRQERAAGGK